MVRLHGVSRITRAILKCTFLHIHVLTCGVMYTGPMYRGCVFADLCNGSYCRGFIFVIYKYIYGKIEYATSSQDSFTRIHAFVLLLLTLPFCLIITIGFRIAVVSTFTVP